MELSVRDWMIIVGLLLVVVVLIDGFRRMRNDRRGGIKLSLNKQFINSTDDIDDLTSSELPSGGARVVGREGRPDQDIDGPGQEDDLQLDQSVPMLMESITTAEPSFEPEEDIAVVGAADGDPVSQLAERDVQAVEGATSIDPEQETARTSQDRSSRVSPDEQEVIVINVAAKDEPFKGSDLLHILLACDCRFGDMNIFHRHEDSSGKGPVQFSVVNAVEPGVFDLDDIDNFTTTGVCFFVGVPGPKDAVHAFDCMVETAQCLVKNLNGELLDDSRSVMTAQTIEHCRQRIRDIVRKQMTQHA